MPAGLQIDRMLRRRVPAVHGVSCTNGRGPGGCAPVKYLHCPELECGAHGKGAMRCFVATRALCVAYGLHPPHNDARRLQKSRRPHLQAMHGFKCHIPKELRNSRQPNNCGGGKGTGPSFYCRARQQHLNHHAPYTQAVQKIAASRFFASKLANMVEQQHDTHMVDAPENKVNQTPAPT
jgi:hypothetical protein